MIDLGGGTGDPDRTRRRRGRWQPSTLNPVRTVVPSAQARSVLEQGTQGRALRSRTSARVSRAAPCSAPQRTPRFRLRLHSYLSPPRRLELPEPFRRPGRTRPAPAAAGERDGVRRTLQKFASCRAAAGRTASCQRQRGHVAAGRESLELHERWSRAPVPGSSISAGDRPPASGSAPRPRRRSAACGAPRPRRRSRCRPRCLSPDRRRRRGYRRPWPRWRDTRRSHRRTARPRRTPPTRHDGPSRPPPPFSSRRNRSRRAPVPRTTSPVARPSTASTLPSPAAGPTVDARGTDPGRVRSPSPGRRGRMSPPSHGLR